MEYFAGNATRPDLPFWETWYGYGPWPGRLDNDISLFTPPIIKPNISTQSDIRSMFSSTTYDKGASINRMLACYMNNDNYFDGLHEYLNTYKYKSVNSDNLLDILNNYDDHSETHNAIKPMMYSWLNQPGYPVLFVDIEEVDFHTLRVSLRQQRNIKEGPQFFTNIDGNKLGHDIYPYYDGNLYDIEQYKNALWHIPIWIKNDLNVTYFHTMMETETLSWLINPRGKTATRQEFYYLNPEYCNFYRTAYTDTAYQWLYQSFDRLEQWEAYSILFDSLQLMQSGYITPTMYLKMIAYVIKPNVITTETIFYFWDRLYDGLISIDNLLCEYYIINPGNTTTNKLIDNFHSFGRSILQPMMAEINGALNWNKNDSDWVDNIRWRMIDLLIRFENNQVIHGGYNILQNAMDNISSIDDTFLRQVFETSFYFAARYNQQSIYDDMINIYRDNINNTDIKNKWLQAVGYLYKNEEFVNEIYKFIMSDDVDDGLKSTGLNSLSETCYSRQYLYNNLNKNESQGMNEWMNINQNAAIQSLQRFATQDMYIKTWELFYSDNDLNENIQTNLTLQNILTNVHWISNTENQDELGSYLQTYVDRRNNDDVERVLLAWILGGVGLVVLIIIIYLVYTKCCRQKATLPNYYEMEKTNNTKYGTMVRDLYD